METCCLLRGPRVETLDRRAKRHELLCQRRKVRDSSSCKGDFVDLELPEPKPELNNLSKPFHLFGQRAWPL